MLTALGQQELPEAWKPELGSLARGILSSGCCRKRPRSEGSLPATDHPCGLSQATLPRQPPRTDANSPSQRDTPSRVATCS